jgi:hypothetical protein
MMSEATSQILALKRRVEALEKALYEAVMPQLSSPEFSQDFINKRTSTNFVAPPYSCDKNPYESSEGARKESDEDFFVSPSISDKKY